MNTSMHERRYANGSVGFALQILFALLFLTALTGQALSSQLHGYLHEHQHGRQHQLHPDFGAVTQDCQRHVYRHSRIW